MTLPRSAFPETCYLEIYRLHVDNLSADVDLGRLQLVGSRIVDLQFTSLGQVHHVTIRDGLDAGDIPIRGRNHNRISQRVVNGQATAYLGVRRWRDRRNDFSTGVCAYKELAVGPESHAVVIAISDDDSGLRDSH